MMVLIACWMSAGAPLRAVSSHSFPCIMLTYIVIFVVCNVVQPVLIGNWPTAPRGERVLTAPCGEFISVQSHPGYEHHALPMSRSPLWCPSLFGGPCLFSLVFFSSSHALRIPFNIRPGRLGSFCFPSCLSLRPPCRASRTIWRCCGRGTNGCGCGAKICRTLCGIPPRRRMSRRPSVLV